MSENRIWPNCTQLVEDILWNAGTVAAKGHGRPEVAPIHILYAIFISQDARILAFFESARMDKKKIEHSISISMGGHSGDNIDDENIPFSEDSKGVLKDADRWRKRMKVKKIDMIHLLLSIAWKIRDGSIMESINQSGFPLPNLKTAQEMLLCWKKIAEEGKQSEAAKRDENLFAHIGSIDFVQPKSMKLGNALNEELRIWQTKNPDKMVVGFQLLPDFEYPPDELKGKILVLWRKQGVPSEQSE